MEARKNWRLTVILLALAVIASWTIWSSKVVRYVEAELILPEEALYYTESVKESEYWNLSYYGEAVPVDHSTSTLYLSKSEQEISSSQSLLDGLRLQSAKGELYFVRDEAFDDPETAVAQGHVFTLLVTDGEQSCMKYNVIFTTLPVMAMDTSYVDEENDAGTLRVWDLYEERNGGSQALSAQVQWHARGMTAQTAEKKSWKLSVKTADGKNKNVDLLGLGSDDDWILNAMNMDDTLQREYLTMGVWNEMVAEYTWDWPMSTGEYVELVLNGEYRGVYLLQRRVDGKYLSLSEELLFKGQSSSTANTVMEVYKLVYSPLNTASSYETMTDVWRDRSRLDLDNFIDLSVYLQFGCLADNTWYKNMFYALCPVEDGYRVTMIPWDTDMGFGTSWEDGTGFVYKPEKMLDRSVTRCEYDDALALYPELDERIAERWFELRENILSWENIQSILAVAQSTLSQSGAYDRNAAVWGQRYDGQDTHEALEQWIQARLQWCDEYYSN